MSRNLMSAMRPTTTPETTRAAPEFAFLTSHGKTLLLIAHDTRIRMRDIAGLLNVTERATQRIVADLARAGYIDRQREGRRNFYTVRTDLPLGLPLQRDADIGALVRILPHAEPGSEDARAAE
jgi:DNA-binding MarR family transcriptional regulator